MENMKITTVVTGILVPLILNNVQCMLDTKPNDTAAKVGDSVTMRCSSSYVSDPCGNINWRHFKMNSEFGDYINNGDQLSPSVTSYISLFNSMAGNCDLRIKAKTSAAGRYQCLDATSDDASAQLVVLENDPEIEIIKTSHSRTTVLGCSVNYHGNWAPKVKWMKNGLESVASNDSEKSKSPVSSVIQSATFDPTGETEYFACIVTISQPGGSNEPIYTWRSLKNDSTWEKKTAGESTTKHVYQGSGGGYGSGIYIVLAVFVTSTCVCAGVIIYGCIMYRKLKNKKPNSPLAEQAPN